MAHLDNKALIHLKDPNYRGKLHASGIVLRLMIASTLALSCGNQRSEVGPSLSQPDKNGATGKIAEADQLYAQREDVSKVRQGVALLREARTADYSSYEAAWKLARISYYLGTHTQDERERDGAFREGTEAGKTAVQLSSEKPEGHFWLGANYGGSAQHSTLTGLSNIEDIRREMEAVLRIDDQFEGGSAYMVLGQLYLEAPRFFGGDYRKALEYLEKGLKVGSNNSLLRLHLAEAYHEAKRDAEARKQIDFLLKMTPNPNYVPEHQEAVEKGKKLLEKIDRSASR